MSAGGSKRHRGQVANRCAGGCGHRSRDGRRFCQACWYQLSLAFRLAIEAARTGRFFIDLNLLVRDAARSLARPANDLMAAPEVAVCGLCQRSSSDPVVTSCTKSDCPLAQKVAA